MQELEARVAQAEAVVATVFPDADVLGPAPAPVAAAPMVSTHSRVLSVGQIAREWSSPHVGLLRSLLRGSRDRSQGWVATSLVA